MRRVAITCFAVLICVTLVRSKAHACSCVFLDYQFAFDQADLVFAGTYVDGARNGFGPPHALEVDHVWKGDVATSIKLKAVSGGGCGYGPFEPGTRYLIFAKNGSETPPEFPTAWLCSGTRPFSLDFEGAPISSGVRSVLGKGHDPNEIPSEDVGVPGTRDPDEHKQGWPEQRFSVPKISAGLPVAVAAIVLIAALRGRLRAK